MTIHWRRPAVNDLANIRDTIARDNPVAAGTVIERILRSVERLERFPLSGRSGRVTGTREIVVPGLPYIVVYIGASDAIDIVAVFHGAQSR